MYVCVSHYNAYIFRTSVTWAGGVIGGRVTVSVSTVLRAEGLADKILRYVYIHLCMYVCMYVCMFACMYVIFFSAIIYVCLYVCMVIIFLQL